jgi:hypothetical protein
MKHTKDEALKLAKSWFESNTYGDEAVEVYEAIEQALAAPVQEATAAINTLKFLGYTYHGGEQWKPPLGECPAWLNEPAPVQEPVTAFDDPLVQTVYNILCDADEGKPREDHWEGWKARRIVAALTTPQTQPAPVQEPVWWPSPEDQPLDNGPECEDGPDEEGFSGPRPWNGFAQPAPVQEPVAALIDENQRLRAELKFNTLPAAQPAVQEPVGYITQARCFVHLHECTEAEAKLYGWKTIYTTPPAQPAVPDALNPKNENPAYAAGWNDCRAEMLKGMKS